LCEHNSGATREPKPFFLQHFRIGGRRTLASDDHNPNAGDQLMLPAAYDLAQPSTNAIPHHRASNPARCDESNPKNFLFLSGQNTQREQRSPDGLPLGSDKVELSSQL
jgi:hypothetical protein